MQIDKCSSCGAAKGPDVKLSRCARCPKLTAPRYCSKACQITGWRGGHRLVCGVNEGGEGRQDVGASTSAPSLPTQQSTPAPAPAPVESTPSAGTSSTTIGHPQRPHSTVRHKEWEESMKERACLKCMAIKAPSLLHSYFVIEEQRTKSLTSS